ALNDMQQHCNAAELQAFLTSIARARGVFRTGGGDETSSYDCSKSFVDITVVGPPYTALMPIANPDVCGYATDGASTCDAAPPFGNDARFCCCEEFPGDCVVDPQRHILQHIFVDHHLLVNQHIIHLIHIVQLFYDHVSVVYLKYEHEHIIYAVSHCNDLVSVTHRNVPDFHNIHFHVFDYFGIIHCKLVDVLLPEFYLDFDVDILTSSAQPPPCGERAWRYGQRRSWAAGLGDWVILCSLSLSGLLGLAIHLRKRRALGADLRDSPAPPSEEVEEADDDYDCEAVESDSKDRAPPVLNQAKLKSWVEEDPTMPSGSADDPLAAESPDIQDTPSDEGPVGGFAADSSIAAHDSPSEEDLAAMREDIGELKGSDQSFPDFIIEI
ncbi:unnamed protein product, partial [Symbiodinium necroappetens]